MDMAPIGDDPAINNIAAGVPEDPAAPMADYGGPELVGYSEPANEQYSDSQYTYYDENGLATHGEHPPGISTPFAIIREPSGMVTAVGITLPEDMANHIFSEQGPLPWEGDIPHDQALASASSPEELMAMLHQGPDGAPDAGLGGPPDQGPPGPVTLRRSPGSGPQGY